MGNEKREGWTTVFKHNTRENQKRWLPVGGRLRVRVRLDALTFSSTLLPTRLKKQDHILLSPHLPSKGTIEDTQSNASTASPLCQGAAKYSAVQNPDMTEVDLMSACYLLLTMPC